MILRQAPCPLALPVIFWLSGIGLGALTEVNPLILFSLTIINFLLLIKFRYNYNLLLLIILLAGVLRYEIALYPKANDLGRILGRHHKLKGEITGEVIRPVSQGYMSKTSVLNLQTLAGKNVSGKIYLRSKEKLEAGWQIHCRASLEGLQRPRNPGARDLSFSLLNQGIAGSGKVEGDLTVTGQRKGLILQLRKGIEKRLKKRLGDEADLATAIFTGNRSGLSWEQKESIKLSGLSHLFAVSGLHVGVMILILYSVLNLVIPPGKAKIILLALMTVYGSICLWTASVTRAILMLAIYTIGNFFERAMNFNQVLFASLFIITIVDPRQFFSVGLQLSYCATFVIINLSPVLEEKLFRLKRNKWKQGIKRILESLILACAVITAISPLTRSHFGTVCFNGVVSVIPASLIFGVLLPLVFCLAVLPIGWQPFASSYRFLSMLFYKWLKICCSFPFYWENLRYEYWKVLITYLLALAAYVLYKRWQKKWSVVCIMVLIAVWFFPPVSIGHRDTLNIYCFDCGQGDMHYLELPGGSNILIDSGPENCGYGSIENSLLPWLKQRRIAELDFLVITHAHNDHYGGMSDLLEAIRVKKIVIGKEFLQDLPDKALVREIVNEKALMVILHNNLCLKNNEVELEFLLPDLEENNQNNKSIVLRVTYREFSALFTGDIEKEAESWLVNNTGKGLESDFLKIPHHGSISSSTEEFIRAVNPRLCFIPAGRNNRFRLPHLPVVKRYSYLGDKLVNGAEEGALLISTDGYEIKARVMLRDSIMVINAD